MVLRCIFNQQMKYCKKQFTVNKSTVIDSELHHHNVKEDIFIIYIVNHQATFMATS